MAYPNTLLSSPFAASGNYTIPPATQTSPGDGRASQATGFPPETQIPISAGGIAPHRWDFNGILNLLSSLAFWQQSGGLFTWTVTLDYAPPALINYGGTLYRCLAPSGPGTTAGARQPGASGSESYWALSGAAFTVDGATIVRNNDVLSAKTATSSSLGVVRPDNSTITINNGVLSSQAAGAMYVTEATSHNVTLGNGQSYSCLRKKYNNNWVEVYSSAIILNYQEQVWIPFPVAFNAIGVALGPLGMYRLRDDGGVYVVTFNTGGFSTFCSGDIGNSWALYYHAWGWA